LVRGTTQANAASLTPLAIRKPLPSPAVAVVDSCLPARRAAEAKRENMMCREAAAKVKLDV